MLKKKSPTEIKPRGWSESMASLYLGPQRKGTHGFLLLRLLLIALILLKLG